MTERARTGLLAAALVLLVGLPYAQVRDHDFVRFDDHDYIVDNPHASAGLSREGVRWAFSSFDEANWHPLTWVSHMIDVELFGMWAGGHHLVAVGLHALAAVLLFLALVRMTGSTWACAFTAALFAIHPLRVESVAWAAERKDVLSALFWMATLLVYAIYVRRPSRARYLGVVACFALGLLAKPMLVTLPVVLLLLDHWPLERRKRGAAPSWAALWAEKVPLFGLAAASAAVTLVAQHRGGAIDSLENLTLGGRFANAAVASVVYLVQTILPFDLAFFYPHPLVVAEDPARALLLPSGLALVALAGLTLAVAVQRTRRPWLTVGWAWYAVTLVPVVGIVQVGNQAHADRYTYIPLVGIYLALAWTVREAVLRRPRLRPAVAVAAVAILAVLAALTWNQLAHWKDSRALFTRALDVTDRNYVAHNNLGNLERREGNPQAALEHYEAALSIRPDLVEALNNRAAVLTSLGRHREAEQGYRRALELDPDHAEAHFNLAVTLAATGREGEAEAHYRRAVALRPELAGRSYRAPS